MNQQLIDLRKVVEPSSGERLILNFLDSKGYKYEREKYFPDLINDRTGNNLFYDFYLPDVNAVIEFDGIFHFKDVDKAKVSEIRRKDFIKNKYCINNNISIIRVNCFEGNVVEKIENFLYEINLSESPIINLPKKQVYEPDNSIYLNIPICLVWETNVYVATLFAIFKAKRDHLIKLELIKDEDSFFFYPIAELQQALLKPNSPNSISRNVKKLVQLGLMETKTTPYPVSLKYYRINEVAFLNLMNKMQPEIDRRRERLDKKFFNKK